MTARNCRLLGARSRAVARLRGAHRGRDQQWPEGTRRFPRCLPRTCRRLSCRRREVPSAAIGRNQTEAPRSRSHRLKWSPTKDTTPVEGERREAISIQHTDVDIGTLSGFDWLVFRGTLRMLAHRTGMNGYLWRVQVLLKDFASHAEALTRQLRGASEELTKRTARPIRYQASGATRARNRSPVKSLGWMVSSED
jgi:hypothetical protein